MEEVKIRGRGGERGRQTEREKKIEEYFKRFKLSQAVSSLSTVITLIKTMIGDALHI